MRGGEIKELFVFVFVGVGALHARRRIHKSFGTSFTEPQTFLWNQTLCMRTSKCRDDKNTRLYVGP